MSKCIHKANKLIYVIFQVMTSRGHSLSMSSPKILPSTGSDTLQPTHHMYPEGKERPFHYLNIFCSWEIMEYGSYGS